MSCWDVRRIQRIQQSTIQWISMKIQKPVRVSSSNISLWDQQKLSQGTIHFCNSRFLVSLNMMPSSQHWLVAPTERYPTNSYVIYDALLSMDIYVKLFGSKIFEEMQMQFVLALLSGHVHALSIFLLCLLVLGTRFLIRHLLCVWLQRRRWGGKSVGKMLLNGSKGIGLELRMWQNCCQLLCLLYTAKTKPRI